MSPFGCRHRAPCVVFAFLSLDTGGTRGELDLYISSSWQWGLELTREGERLGEHITRLNEKYRPFGLRQAKLVDLRAPGSAKVTSNHPDRIVVYFHEHYMEATVVSFKEDETVDQKAVVKLRT